jgi:hypothetical protein
MNSASTPARHADVGVELELIDPKFETFDLFRKYVAAMWLGANDAGRELLERSVRVIDWSHERVTPLTRLSTTTSRRSRTRTSRTCALT